jgi:hypothetical protein
MTTISPPIQTSPPTSFPFPKSEWTFNQGNLYGASGRPVAADIHQSSIGDCCLASFMGATAMEQPARIEDAIRFDAATGNFVVTLYRPVEIFGAKFNMPVEVEVSQADIQDNIARGGASWLDDTGEGACWPAVMEAAYAKMRDGDPSDGLDAGYESLGGIGAQDSVEILSGARGEGVSGADNTTEQMYAKIQQAFAEGRPVTLCGHPEPDGTDDGMVDMHDYMVEAVWRDDETGEIMIRVRNPWSDNVDGDEGSRTGATMELRLADVNVGDFDIGLPYQG